MGQLQKLLIIFQTLKAITGNSRNSLQMSKTSFSKKKKKQRKCIPSIFVKLKTEQKNNFLNSHIPKNRLTSVRPNISFYSLHKFPLTKSAQPQHPFFA